MGNPAVAEELLGSDKLDELYKLNASGPDDIPHEDIPEDEDGDDEDVEPEDIPHE